MATIHQFKELEIWQLAFNIYKKLSPIAEGFERNSRLDFLNSLSISKGECNELKSQTHRSLLDKYISQ